MQPHHPAAGSPPTSTHHTAAVVAATEVILEESVRTNPTVPPTLAASIRVHGVLNPPIGYTDDQNRIVIRDGARRVAAAATTGRPLPVTLIDCVDTRTSTRIIQQLVLNANPGNLPVADVLRAYLLLHAEGLDQHAIAINLGIEEQEAHETLVIAQSPAASALVSSGRATAPQAAILTGYGKDAPTVQAIIDRIEEGYSADQLQHFVATSQRIGPEPRNGGSRIGPPEARAYDSRPRETHHSDPTHR